MRTFIFPGQGSQTVGMGLTLAKAYPDAARVFEEVDSTLGISLSQIIWEGPDDVLTLTENAQPALLAVSVAILRALSVEGYDFSASGSYVAGHSLGEYSALTAVGSLSLADSARLLRLRGQAMQRAVPVGRGAMAAILGLDFDIVRELAQEACVGDEVCALANDNAPGQIVISGFRSAVLRAIAGAREAGAKRAIELAVSAPFHCSLMQPAQDEMATALAEIEINPPGLPVIANVTAAPTRTPEEIRALLVAQVTGLVRWRESMLYLADAGVDELVEIGAGKVLTGLARRIDPRLSARALNTAEDVVAFLNP